MLVLFKDNRPCAEKSAVSLAKEMKKCQQYAQGKMDLSKDVLIQKAGKGTRHDSLIAGIYSISRS